ncbi:MAG: glycosyltransferase family 2 protein [Cyclobacteriaceae bacterium]
MKSNPLVSVLMTAYNRKRYLAEAIESVLASTYRNFELIIVDDCSTDSTLAIAKQYEAKDNRVKAYVNERNLGDYPNRNKAASYATGKYLVYIDADDLIYYFGLEIMVESMERFPEAGFGLNGISQDHKGIFPRTMSPSEAYLSHFVDKTGLFDLPPTGSIIRRSIFEAENGFKEPRMVGDFEMWLRLSSKYSVVIIPYGVTWSRGHDDSESGRWMTDWPTLYKYTLVRLRALEDKACPLTSTHRERIISIINRQQLKMRLKLITTLKFNQVKKIILLDKRSLIKLGIASLQ